MTLMELIFALSAQRLKKYPSREVPNAQVVLSLRNRDGSRR